MVLTALLGVLSSAALSPLVPQGGLNPRGVDAGYPYPIGCLDRPGYVRPEDVGIRDPKFLQVLASLRANRAAEAGGLLPKLAPSDRNAEVVRSKLWLDYHILTGDVDRYWERLNREVETYEASKEGRSLGDPDCVWLLLRPLPGQG